MDTTREQRELLKALSTEIFGVSSRYQKLYEGQELVTKTVTETVPGENGAPDTQKEVKVPVLAANGAKQFRVVRRSTEEVLELLQGFKVKRDEFLAQMKQQQEEAQAAKAAEDLAKKVQEDFGGSALT